MEMAPPGQMKGGSAPIARFDDLTSGGSSIEFSDPEQILVAGGTEEVVPTLRAVEEAVAEGRWAIGFLAYEAVTGLDPNLSTRQLSDGEPLPTLPLAWFGLFSAPRAVEQLQESERLEPSFRVSGWHPAIGEAEYQSKVETVRAAIEAGETYQCNLTLPIRSRIEGDLFDFYRQLALAQRGAYNAYLDTGRHVIASASPELFFDWTADRVEARPMKGTAPRGRWPEEDCARAHELLQSPKEQAENVMIVDLLRNDLGKVGRPGTVEVSDLFHLERFETLWQLTSTVRARVPPTTGLTELLRALFPSGSVTGAPKPRTMALISELEVSRRGVYCGAIGMVAPPGASFRARFSVPIRTAVVDRLTGDAVYGTGGGITWDSNAAAEHRELVTKSAILHRYPVRFQLIETMAYQPGPGLRNCEDHLRRLAASAEYFGFQLDLASVRTRLSEATRGASEAARVRLLVDRDGVATIELASMPPPSTEPVRLTVDRKPVQSAEIWLYHKTTKRTTYESRKARHRDVDDVVMVNERGELTETTVANLALHLDGKWLTPSHEAGCLPGVQRGRLIAEGTLKERALYIEDLRRAQQIALVSSLRGWRVAVLKPDLGLAPPNRSGGRNPAAAGG
ncbi:MAG: aminodeoxychorismate synthase component I [Candidatus Dormibacteria bacterium]